MTPYAVRIDDVLIVRRTDRGWMCEIAGRPTFVERSHLAPGSRVPSEGGRGPLELTVTAARALGVLRQKLA